MRVGVAMTLSAVLLAAGCARPSAVTPRSAPAAAAIPPLTPADLQARMTTIQGALGAVHMKLAENRVTDAAVDAQVLATTFADVERFWSQHRRDDAIRWARRARSDAAAMTAAAAANDGRKTAAAMDRLSSTCQQCHATYRDGSPESGFRIKPGIV